MKIVALCQCYNEEYYIYRALKQAYPFVDELVISEGCLSPFGGLSAHSTDGTRKEIERFIEREDKDKKVRFIDAYTPEQKVNNREKFEGLNKNNMLAHSSIEHGDLIYILDADEFFSHKTLGAIREKSSKNDKIVSIKCEEYQFAYNHSLCFDASHPRWFRYVDGGHFSTTNHFIYPDGTNITRQPSWTTKREKFPFYHMCWTKHPWLIREKVISFNRPSFTAWFNNVYLVWPLAPKRAYENNKKIPPHFGTGFCEGQHGPLYIFPNDLPVILEEIREDWMPYIVDNRKDLFIK